MAFVLGLGFITIMGMSSFTKNSKTGVLVEPHTFVNVNYATNPNSMNPADYEYRPSAICNDSEEIITCSARWLEPTAPSIGDPPSGTYDTKLSNGEVELVP